MVPATPRSNPGAIDPTAVFLNVPFDARYERIFIALVAALTSIGRKPRCVLELPERGEGRLSRILDLLQHCQVSVDDLSRAGRPPRYNIPFELGLAYSQREFLRSPSRHIILLESERHRLAKTLSDLAGRDPAIHSEKPRRAISCILDTLGSGSSDPCTSDVYRMWMRLLKASRELKKRAGHDDIYTTAIFKKVVAASAQPSVRFGFIRP